MKGRKRLSLVRQAQCGRKRFCDIARYSRNKSHVRRSQIWSQTIAKFATYLSMSQIRVYNHIKRLYGFKKLGLITDCSTYFDQQIVNTYIVVVYVRIYVINDAVSFERKLYTPLSSPR